MAITNNDVTKGILRDGWTKVIDKDNPRLVDHPTQEAQSWNTTMVRLALRGDAVPITRIGKPGNKCLEVCSSSS